MSLKYIKGLKYPDEYFIKFFFKYHLFEKENLTYLELGCSNGCNLMLPYQYNNSIIGVDLNSTLIEYAYYNFKALKQKNPYKFYTMDMRTFCNISSNIKADVLVLANSIYYIPKDDFVVMLKNINKNNLIKSNIPFFIKVRNIDDFRYGKGKKVDENSYLLQNSITGEDGLFCTFYNAEEIVYILEKELNLRDYQVMKIIYENIQNNTKVTNSDIVIWGNIN